MIRFGINSDGREDAVAAARRAEALGFDSYGVGEHVFFHYPTTSAMVSLAAAATATERIALVASVVLLPLYPPALLAKMATTLDLVSGGRFQLGVGVGGEHPPEFAACGVPLAERGSRADEALAVLRALWSEGPAPRIGERWDIEGLALDPSPAQRGGPPIWIAGRSDAALHRAVRFGDGWMPLFCSPDRLRRDVAALHELAERRDRDPATVRVGAVVLTCVHDDRQTALDRIARRLSANYTGDYARLAERIAAAGPPADCIQKVEAYLDAGADTIFFAPMGDLDQASADEERLAAEVVAALR